MTQRAEFTRAFRGRRVLITGGLGFIGSNLARSLVRLGAKVTILDSLIPEYGGNRRNVGGLERKLDLPLSAVPRPPYPFHRAPTFPLGARPASSPAPPVCRGR